MTATAAHRLPADDRKMGISGLKAAFNILEKWECSADQAQAILRLPKATYYKYRSDPESARLDRDQLARISYLLNIHQALRVVFGNPENVYGFMRKRNHNPYFNGRAPLEVIESGDFSALYETFRRVDILRSGLW
ncbi:MAG TPA: antitoxin Xre-like helix-turn-helix domain-containing protein [Marinobacter sp.]|nr:antitoxin Xre-like helix-turn-helix domain-containing protein [Marinobacter sp.]